MNRCVKMVDAASTYLVCLYAARIAAAGGDLVMPGGPADLKAMRNGLKNGTLTRRQLMINGTRVFRLAKRLTEEAEGAR